MRLRTFRHSLIDLMNDAWPVEIDPDDNTFGESESDEPDGTTPPEGAVLTAIVLVVEWQGSDGRRWLSRYGSLGSGDPLPRWSVEMLCREGLRWERTP